MAETYTLCTPPPGMQPMVLLRVSDNTVDTFIPLNLENMDYQAFLAWMAEGNPAPEGWTGPTNTSPATG